MTDTQIPLLDALRKHARPDGSLYVICLDDVAGYLHERPDLAALLDGFDPDELAMEIMDAIGSLGILELVEEHALRGTIQEKACWGTSSDYDDLMDGDPASALASAGWGMDEDYGCFDSCLEG